MCGKGLNKAHLIYFSNFLRAKTCSRKAWEMIPLEILQFMIKLSFKPFPNKPWFLRSLDPTVYSTHFENILPFSSNIKLLSANYFSSKESKFCHLGKC